VSILEDAREGMNVAIRPQDDLFGHVNGRWLDETEIPSDRSSWGPFVQLADIAEDQVRTIIEDLARVVAEGAEGAIDEDARKIGDLFYAFMDTDTINRKGIEPVRPLIAAVAGLRDVRDLAAFLGEFERIGGHGLFGSYVTTDSKDSDRYLFNLVQGGLGLPDETYYVDDKFAEIREKYAAYLTRLFTLGGHDDADRAAATVLAIDTRLAAGHWERSETRDVQKTYNLMTKADLVELCPSFDWDAYVTNLGGSDDTLAEVCVRQPSYFSHLSAVLDEVPVEEWREWLLSHVLRASAAYLTDDFVEANFDFYGRTLNGTPELRARWKRGVAFVEGAIGEAVGKEYVARHFPPRSKAMMDELVANLLAAYRVSIKALDWMTEETKQRAYDKLDRFRPKIGYPEKFRDYSALQVSRDDLLGNVAAASAFETDRELGKIGSPVDRDEWFMLPQTVNAYYNPGTNEICFPAGILQAPSVRTSATSVA
jgi:putative endopeptidase